ncbi:unnamed protein product, partial [Penicillium salamii]
CDLDLDLHAIWQESSGMPTPPPCLATDSDNPRWILSHEGEPTGYKTAGSSLIECLFHPLTTSCQPSSELLQTLCPCLLRLATCSSTCQRSLSLKKCTG